MSETMQGLWLEKQKLQFCTDLPKPDPQIDEALIRVLMAGVCSTDLELLRGYYPFTGIPGHEFVGEVVRCPGNPGLEGKRVVGEINISCGNCEMCKIGLNRHCEQRKTLGIHDWNGVFAEFVVLPLVNIHPIPDPIPNEVAVFTEPLAAAHEILEQVNLRKTDRILLIGAGRLGQLIADVIYQTGCPLDVIARYQNQVDLLSKRNIHTICAEQIDTSKYDIVVEATGSADGFYLATQSVRPRGTIILKSTYKGNAEINFSQIVVDEISLIGSRCGSFEPAINLLAMGKVDPRVLIDAVFPLDKGIDAFEFAARSGVLKVMVQPDFSIDPH
jgi:threonine dehydrogenase-like Zn-dependent dehydrogenase